MVKHLSRPLRTRSMTVQFLGSLCTWLSSTRVVLSHLFGQVITVPFSSTCPLAAMQRTMHSVSEVQKYAKERERGGGTEQAL